MGNKSQFTLEHFNALKLRVIQKYQEGFDRMFPNAPDEEYPTLFSVLITQIESSLFEDAILIEAHQTLFTLYKLGIPFPDIFKGIEDSILPKLIQRYD